MTWHFESEENRERLLATLADWRGQPFRPRHLDCITFIAAVLQAVGAIPLPIQLPRNYPLRSGRHLGDIAAALDRLGMEQVTEAPLAGDVLVARLLRSGSENPGGAPLHLAIVGAIPAYWHCLPGRGVQEGNLHDPHGLHLEQTWRLPTQA